MGRQDIIDSLKLSPFYSSMSRAEKQSTVEMLEARCQALGLLTQQQLDSNFLEKLSGITDCE
ncbi:MAG: hypothetical protein V3V52_03315 [Candidatus Adiutricales bacterium]|jgi:hypothetical protein